MPRPLSLWDEISESLESLDSWHVRTLCIRVHEFFTWISKIDPLSRDEKFRLLSQVKEPRDRFKLRLVLYGLPDDSSDEDILNWDGLRLNERKIFSLSSIQQLHATLKI